MEMESVSASQISSLASFVGKGLEGFEDFRTKVKEENESTVVHGARGGDRPCSS